MQTPTKDYSNKFVSSDFEPTHSKKTSNTLSHQDSSNSLDLLHTPKPTTLFYPYPDRPLRVNHFRNIKNNRARLMDWYLQLFPSYNLGWDSYWFAVELLDTLIADFSYISIENVHITGIVCFFIASKIQGKNNISMNHLVAGVAHNKFSKQQILQEEGRVLNLIFQNSNFQRITIYSYLMEKYQCVTTAFLSKAMQMLVLALMRPEVSYSAMRVNTYRQLVDYVMIELSANRSISVLQRIRAQIKTSFGNQNITEYCKKISL